ncbi:hypothetical protein AB6A40_008385 [Gnathostoma spinigerum]|uniref:Uncharacterized protein n=1 Tax=Gnathostoma spinigerum TaxID=75299 RepID=A0ABD6EQU7_9BILA
MTSDLEAASLPKTHLFQSDHQRGKNKFDRAMRSLFRWNDIFIFLFANNPYFTWAIQIATFISFLTLSTFSNWFPMCSIECYCPKCSYWISEFKKALWMNRSGAEVCNTFRIALLGYAKNDEG